MELVIILILLIISVILGYFIFNIQITNMKKARNNNELDEIASRFPENKQICKEILEKLNNTKVKIKEESEENKKTSTSLYVAITDTIFIGNIKDSYTRIQTICHECLHSIQPRRLLLFNFIFSNIYYFYFILSIILTFVGVFKDIRLQIIILLILSFIYFIIRSYLENDAMIKARYLAREYMLDYIEKENICTREDVKKIVKEYDRINLFGIPAYNFTLFFNCVIKIIIYILIFLIKNSFL